MTIVQRQAWVAYSHAQMFQLVDDIAAYPQFLPWCKRTEVISRDDDQVQATLELAWGGFHKSFTTANRLQQNKMIEIRLVDGPFRHLDGFWQFEPVCLQDIQGCKVQLALEFDFSNRLLSMAFSRVFEQIANNLVDAFCKRAKQLYDQP